MASSLPRLPDSTNIPFGVASAAAFGALNLVDPDRLGRRGRLALRLAWAVTQGVWIAASIDADTPPVPARAAAGVLATQAGWVLVGRSWALDRRTLRWLAARGVRHPRRWLAASSVVTTLAMLAADRSAAAATDSVPEEETPRTRPLSQEAREVVRAVLTAAGTADAAVLLTQLDTAEEVVWWEDPVDRAADQAADQAAEAAGGQPLWPLELRVAEGVPLVVPHRQLFPVRGRFEDARGTELEVALEIGDGRLSSVTVAPADGGYGDVLGHWPAPARLRFVRDSPRGGTVPVD